MTIKTILRIVDNFIPMDKFDVPMRLVRNPLDDPEIINRIENEWRKMYLNEEENNFDIVNPGWNDDIPPLENVVFDDAMPPLIDPEFADQLEQVIEQAFDDMWHAIVPNVAWQNPQGQQLFANMPEVDNHPNIVYISDEVQGNELFDSVIEAMTNSSITDIYKLLGQVGKISSYGYTHFPCRNCLAYGWNGGDGIEQYRPGRCCKECDDQPNPNHVHEDILNKGTWSWDENICRDDKYEEEMFFDLIVETMKRGVFCDFDFVLEHCGQEDGYTCLKCLQYKNEWWEGCDDCEDFCRDEHPLPSNVLKMGTWAWSMTKSRDENGIRYQFDDDMYETDHRDAGLDDRDYEDDYDY